MFLADLQQDGLPKLDGEALVLLVLLVVNDLDLDDLPAFGKKRADGEMTISDRNLVP